MIVLPCHSSFAHAETTAAPRVFATPRSRSSRTLGTLAALALSLAPQVYGAGFTTSALGAAPAPAASPARPAAPRAVDNSIPTPPLREFRGVWIATVANIDWPSRKGLSIVELRAEMNTMLDRVRDAGMNAVVFQVRPGCDAMYRSNLEPWSEFLSGQSGQLPADAPADYDPLQEWLAASHARSLQLHAWFNPFRARHIRAEKPDAPSHISRTRPELVRSYDGYLWLDPGEPDARAHSLSVVMDIVNRYDIDGIHFDDYFYPYPKAGQEFPDQDSFAKNARPGTKRDDWRRDNINTFVRELYTRVKASKPHVLVGISPFGIWRPNRPPQVRGFDAYASLYADARLWLREGWCDYMSPQLYWKAEAPQQPYARLLDWWIDQNDQSRHIWPGLNASRVLPEDPTPASNPKARESWEPADILRQIDLTRASQGASGVVAFSAIAITQDRRGLARALATRAFGTPALIPATPWLALPGSRVPELRATITRNPSGAMQVTAQPPAAPAAAAPASPPSGLTLVVMGRAASAAGVPPDSPARWKLIGSSRGTSLTIPPPTSPDQDFDAFSAAWMDRLGRLGPWQSLKP